MTGPWFISMQFVLLLQHTYVRTANSPLNLHNTASHEICGTILKLMTFTNELVFSKYTVCKGLRIAWLHRKIWA